MKKLLIALVLLVGSHLSDAQLPATAQEVSPLLTGEKIPDATLTDAAGNTVETAALFAKQKTILLFYRGGWCPYCTRQLADVAKVQADLDAMGYQVVAISPDKPEKALETAKKGSGNITLLSDGNGDLSKKIGVAFQSPANYQKVLKDNSDPSFLPVPTVLIVDTEGKILYEYINPDYKVRIPAELLKINAAYFADK